ncbi:MAG: sulfite exporter TauE/SafE family protein [Chloroflexi bacterium]|nr:sulfite exporter TauE/SafE family protein [Chloroflexota bacterium]
MTDLVSPVGFGFAFWAGIVSFLSPCVVPLVPGYLSYVSGVSVDELEKPGRRQFARILLSSLLFVLGFTLAFVALGASASLLGSLLEGYRRELTVAAGVVMVSAGILMLNVIRIPFLAREMRFHPQVQRFGMLGGIPLGMAFGLGWLPCIGPVLASILFYASTTDTLYQGTFLLLVYSLGLGLAFTLTGIFFGHAAGALRWIQRHRRILNYVGGGVLIIMGLLFITNRFFFISLAAQKFFYRLFY